MHDSRADGALIRLCSSLSGQKKHGVGDPGFIKLRGDALSRRPVCVSVGKDKHLSGAVRFKHIGNSCGNTASDHDARKSRTVALSAPAAELSFPDKRLKVSTHFYILLCRINKFLIRYDIRKTSENQEGTAFPAKNCPAGNGTVFSGIIRHKMRPG